MIWGLYDKSFTAVINSVEQLARAFANVSHFLLALMDPQTFYVTELIMAVISFMIQAPEAGSCNILVDKMS